MAESSASPVYIGGVRGGVEAAVRQALEATGNLAWLKSGDRVYLKLASNSGNPYPATTSPAGLSAVVRALRDKGARVIVCETAGVQFVKLTRDRLRGSTRKLMEQNGLAKAALEAGAELYFPEEKGWGEWVEEEPMGTSWKNPVTVPRLLREVDHVVLLPRVSRHVLAGSTLGAKAAVGYWRTDTRLEYHRDSATLQEKTAEANAIPSLLTKQRLVLTVADRLQTTFGPDQGYHLTPDEGIVFASDCIIRHDMVALAFLLHGRSQTPKDKFGAVGDPNTNHAAVQVVSRAVTWMLGGAREAAKMEPLANPVINSIWDDRVLRRAFELAGGVPPVKILADGISDSLKAKLAQMTTPV